MWALDAAAVLSSFSPSPSHFTYSCLLASSTDKYSPSVMTDRDIVLSPTDPDQAPLAWFAEWLPHLGVVDLRCKGVVGREEGLVLRAGQPLGQLRLGKGKSPEDEVPISLPVPSIESCTVKSSGNPSSEELRSFRFRTAKQDHSGLMEELRVPLSAKDLRSLSGIQCRHCTRSVTRPQVEWRRIRDLPSEGWEELVGAWACHDEVYAKEARAQGILAGTGMCFVGQSYLQLSVEDVDLPGIEVRGDEGG